MTSQLLGAKGNPDASPTSQGPSSRSIDALMIVVTLLVVAMRMWMLDKAWFFVDDWPLALQTTTRSGFIRGYNGHLSTVIIAVYWVLLNVFGFSTYLPYKLVGMLGLVSPGITLYFTTRRRIGPALAALAGLVLLLPAHVMLTVPAFNHYLALTFGILCAAALNSVESRRSNVKVAGFLALSLASAGGGVAVAAGAILFCCCTRPSWRRWLAVALPTALWAMWWFAMPGYRGPDGSGRRTPTMSQLVSSAVSGFRHVLDTFGPIEFFGALFAVTFVIRASFAIKGGLRGSANLVAWTGALSVWLVALAWTRDAYTGYVFRYDFVGLGFVLLAMIPTKPIQSPRLRPRATTRNTVIIAVAILAVAGLLGVSTHSATRSSARSINTLGARNLVAARYVNLGPRGAPDAEYQGMWFYGRTAREIRSLFATYGGMPVTPQTRDRAMLASTSVAPSRWHRDDLQQCETSWSGGTLPEGLYLVSPAPGPPVDLRGRYLGPTWQLFGQAPGGKVTEVIVAANAGPLQLQVSLRPDRPGTRVANIKAKTVTCLP